MKIISLLACAFIIPFLIGCTKTEEVGIGTIKIYVARPCDTVRVFNAFLIHETFEQLPYTIKERFNNDSMNEIIAIDYLLDLNIGPKGPYRKFDVETLSNDTEITQQMVLYYELKGKKGGSTPEYVEYRVEELERIIITCNQTLFGLETGSSLNDKFEIMRDILPFYFTYDKQMIVKDEPWGAIDDYLARRPMAPATLYLRLTEIPPEAPCEVAFSVEVKVADKEPFHATAQPITLLR